MGFKEISVWDPDMLGEHNLSTTSWPEKYLGSCKSRVAAAAFETLNKKCKLIPQLF